MTERIILLRKELGLSQQKFADNLGIARGNIAAYEVGKNAPSDAVISLICAKFSVNEEWLRNGSGEMFIQKSRDEELAEFFADVQIEGEDSFRHKFLQTMAQLDYEDWEVIRKIAESLAEKYK